MSGNLQQIPSAWRSVELREVGQIVTGSTPPKAHKDFYGGTFPFVKPPELIQGPILDTADKLSEKGAEVADVAPPGSVLVSCIGNLGKVGLATRAMAFNQQINAIIPNRSEDSKWIFYAVQTFDFATQLADVSSATTISIVNKSKFSGLQIPLPPIDDQHRIVAKIEKQFTRLDAGVVALKRVQANLKRYRAAVLKAACKGKLVPTEAELARAEGRPYEPADQLLTRILTERRKKWNGKGKYKEPAAPDTSNLPALPEGWTWCMSDAIFSFITSGSRGWAKYYSETGSIFLRIGNLNHENIRLDLTALQHVTPPTGTEGVRTVVQSNDILVSITADVGMVGLVPDGLGEAYINQHVALARPVSSITPIYLAYFLCASEGGWGYLKKLQRGATKVGLGLDDIRAVPIPLPPLAEQTRIVADVDRRLSVVEELEAVVDTNIQRGTRLRQAILQKAFSGGFM